MPKQPAGGKAGAGTDSGRVTSADVARLAGVSRATVSQILNQQVARFSADTVQRVRASAATLGYVRSAAGRALVKGHSDFIVLVVPYTTFPKLQDVVEALSVDLEEIGFSVVVHFSIPRAPGAMPGRLHHLVMALRPAGVVDLGGLSDDDIGFMEGAGCPVVPRERLDYNSSIGRLQARHLHDRGYTEIAYAFLSDARDDAYGQERARAVSEFCAARGLAQPTYFHVPIEADGAQRELGRLLGRRRRPVGIACYNDVVGVALVFAAQRLGLAVPGDVAVIGAEDVDVGQLISPRLTTVASDVSGVLLHIRNALARTYEGLASPGEVPPPEESFTLVLGETT